MFLNVNVFCQITGNDNLNFDPAPETLRGWTRWEMISVAVFLVGDGLSIGSDDDGALSCASS